MIRYFVDGVPVPRKQALKIWLCSRTYWNANPRTRDVIFTSVEKGISRHGEIEHLREAGVRIEPDSPQEASE